MKAFSYLGEELISLRLLRLNSGMPKPSARLTISQESETCENIRLQLYSVFLAVLCCPPNIQVNLQELMQRFQVQSYSKLNSGYLPCPENANWFI